VQRLFFALVARENYKVCGVDAQDACAHSPPPEALTFVSAVSMTLTRTCANTGSRRNWIGLLSSLSCMPFNAVPNLVNSGKSTLLLSCDHHRSTSKAPQTIVPSGGPLLRVQKSFCCAKFTTLLLLVPMKNLPSVSATRLINDHSCHMKMHSLSSAWGSHVDS